VESVVAARRETDLVGQTFDIAPARTPRAYAWSKRALDIALSASLLILALPIIALIALLIRMDSPGPVVFKQQRVARGGRLFSFLKFRTMYADARQRFPELYAYRYSPEGFGDFYFKTPDDPRLTRVGRRLRRTSLDELPNLVNVLRGEMSLVGPRPELPEHLRYYGERELVKFSVQPGVTGLWQIRGRARLRYIEQLESEIEYVQRRSFLFDLEILARTPLAVLTGDGAF
jgi:lipopolysaccharide/colanic/teichoic acid biosynthesis glycosyltransferase